MNTINTQKEYKYDAYVTYAQEDSAWVEGVLLKYLEAANLKVISSDKFLLGKPTIEAFQDAVSNSKRTLIVISPTYLAGNKNTFIDLLAQYYGYDTGLWSVIPIIRKAAPTLPPRLSQLVKLDMSDDNDGYQTKALQRLFENLQTPLPTIDRPKCPYPGLRAFTEKDSDYFFGRNNEVSQVIHKLTTSHFAILIGASGCGKSSIVNAGVIPQIRSSGLDEKRGWVIKTIRPTELPDIKASTLNEILFDNSVNDAAKEKNSHYLLFIDQFEEVFDKDISEQKALYKEINNLKRKENIYVVATIRADYLADLLKQLSISKLVKHNSILITELDEDGLQEAIEKPATAVGVAIESTLIAKLVGDSHGGTGVLPFMQETMRRLWGKINGRYLSLNAYEDLVIAYKDYYGEDASVLEIVMSAQADQAMSELTDDQEKIAHRIFLQLINFGQGHDHTRRQQLLNELQIDTDKKGDFKKVIEVLVNRRLIVLGSNIDLNEAKNIRVDISHEILITSWRTLASWIVSGEDDELLKREVIIRYNEWLEYNKNKEQFLPISTIKKIKKGNQSSDGLGNNHRSYIKKSIKNYNPGWNKKGFISIVGFSTLIIYILYLLFFYISAYEIPTVFSKFFLILLVFSFLLLSLLLLFYVLKTSPAFLQKLSNYFGRRKIFNSIMILSWVFCLYFGYNYLYKFSKIEKSCKLNRASYETIFAINKGNISYDEAIVFKERFNLFLRNNSYSEIYDKKVISKCSKINYFQGVFNFYRYPNNNISVKITGLEDYFPKNNQVIFDKGKCEVFLNLASKIRRKMTTEILGIDNNHIADNLSCSDSDNIVKYYKDRKDNKTNKSMLVFENIENNDFFRMDISAYLLDIYMKSNKNNNTLASTFEGNLNNSNIYYYYILAEYYLKNRNLNKAIYLYKSIINNKNYIDNFYYHWAHLGLALSYKRKGLLDKSKEQILSAYKSDFFSKNKNKNLKIGAYSRILYAISKRREINRIKIVDQIISDKQLDCNFFKNFLKTEKIRLNKNFDLSGSINLFFSKCF